MSNILRKIVRRRAANSFEAAKKACEDCITLASTLGDTDETRERRCEACGRIWKREGKKVFGQRLEDVRKS